MQPAQPAIARLVAKQTGNSEPAYTEVPRDDGGHSGRHPGKFSARQLLHKEVQARLLGDIAKDLTNAPLADIQKALAA